MATTNMYMVTMAMVTWVTGRKVAPYIGRQPSVRGRPSVRLTDGRSRVYNICTNLIHLKSGLDFAITFIGAQSLSVHAAGFTFNIQMTPPCHYSAT